MPIVNQVLDLSLDPNMVTCYGLVKAKWDSKNEYYRFNFAFEDYYFTKDGELKYWVDEGLIYDYCGGI